MPLLPLCGRAIVQEGGRRPAARARRARKWTEGSGPARQGAARPSEVPLQPPQLALRGRLVVPAPAVACGWGCVGGGGHAEVRKLRAGWGVTETSAITMRFIKHSDLRGLL